VKRAGDVAYALYASRTYLKRRPLRSRDSLHDHPILGSPAAGEIESTWLARLDPRARATFLSTSTLSLLAAARASAGVAVLPRYLADAEPTLRRIPMPDEPSEPLWLTVHRDLRDAPRVRALLDHLSQTIADDALLLRGKTSAASRSDRRR
jgi:DNA-binding transcriptional LysR family regulator